MRTVTTAYKSNLPPGPFQFYHHKGHCEVDIRCLSLSGIPADNASDNSAVHPLARSLQDRRSSVAVDRPADCVLRLGQAASTKAAGSQGDHATPYRCGCRPMLQSRLLLVITCRYINSGYCWAQHACSQGSFLSKELTSWEFLRSVGLSVPCQCGGMLGRGRNSLISQ